MPYRRIGVDRNASVTISPVRRWACNSRTVGNSAASKTVAPKATTATVALVRQDPARRRIALRAFRSHRLIAADSFRRVLP